MNVSAVGARVVSLPGVIVGGVQPNALVIARSPVEDSLLAKGRRGQRGSKHKRENSSDSKVFHSSSIGTQGGFGGNIGVEDAFPQSILSERTDCGSRGDITHRRDKG